MKTIRLVLPARLVLGLFASATQADGMIVPVPANTRQQNEVLATQQAADKPLVKLRGAVYNISD